MPTMTRYACFEHTHFARNRADFMLSVRNMLEHSIEAVTMIGDKHRSDLDEERMLQLALARLIEIIGEAAARVSEETKHK